jgi:CO/xanthine dehydrogenase FAD-binding subunit
MERFGYVRAQDIPEALHLLNEPGIRSRVLCGGTDLLLDVRPDVAEPEKLDFDRVVDVSLVEEMKNVVIDDRFSLGAGLTYTDVLDHGDLCRRLPFLAGACASVAAIQVRNMGTIGGNIANASAAADMLPVLVCLDAEAVVATDNGQRREPVGELVQGPGRTSLLPGELIVAFEFDPPPDGARTVFFKLGRRNAMTIARMSLAAIGRLDDEGRVDVMRLAPGSILAKARRVVEVETTLMGQIPSDELLTTAGRLMAEIMISESGRRWSTEYKEPVAAGLTTRVLAEALDGGGRA